MQCQVSNCRYAFSHTTRYHSCGICHQFGHGQLEHNNPNRILRLRQFYSDTVSQPCTILGCLDPDSHLTIAHYCELCDVRGVACECLQQQPENVRPAPEPPLVLVDIPCPMCRVPSNVDLEKTVFTATECSICMDSKPSVIFDGCRHAIVCADCAKRIV